MDRDDKNEKKLSESSANEPVQRQENEEGLYLVNDDGTPFDTEDRTYISVDNLPEEDSTTDTAEEG